jgi:hypothetical protein
MFDSPAMLLSIDQALYHLTEAMPFSTFDLLGIHRLHWPVPHRAASPTTSDMTVGSAATFHSQQLATQSLISLQQPTVQFYIIQPLL